jgi:uncharacterized protein
MANHLVNETSPYLLGHSHNPVDWYPWGDEALAKSSAENKPILVSIGYSSCHWCHVMERESFEDPNIAALMNAHFVNIKVDREERPDLDHIYMDAVQAMVGSGGWPLNVFLTPECKPFYGGTYFAPRRSYNRPSWKEILESVIHAYQHKNKELVDQAESLTAHLLQSNLMSIQSGENETDFSRIFNPDSAKTIFENIMSSADKQLGGFGNAPKFPQTFVIQYLLHYSYFTNDTTALKQACLSLDRMIAGGIYDHLAGGFSRYSTDDSWLVPHFEKMIYDNALLVTVLCEAYQLTKNEIYANTIRQTMKFIKEEMYSVQKGFFSAFDADSEGVEGKYYVWSKLEIDNILGKNSEIFCAFYGVSDKGNWEGHNILHEAFDFSEFASTWKTTPSQLTLVLKNAREQLLNKRTEKIAPLLDNKIILSWNALMNAACTKAYEAIGEEEYKALAVDNMRFLLETFRQEGLHYFAHCFTAGQLKFPAFLDDYAFLISALIQLQEITANTVYLEKAREIADYVIENFEDKDNGMFFFSHQLQRDIIVRKKEIYDGATPSGNAIMVLNLLKLSIIFDIPEWKNKAISACISISKLILKYPTSFGIWATVLQAITYVIPEVVVTGSKLNTISKEILSNFIPFKIYQSTILKNDQFPLLKDKPIFREPLIFLCKGYVCQPPVTETSEFIQLLRNVQKNTP